MKLVISTAHVGSFERCATERCFAEASAKRSWQASMPGADRNVELRLPDAMDVRRFHA